MTDKKYDVFDDLVYDDSNHPDNHPQIYRYEPVDDVVEDVESLESFHPRDLSVEYCERCGHDSHKTKHCIAQYHVNGTSLPPKRKECCCVIL
jgi:hypothetical protein